jgi:hypothetical protein
MAKVFGPDTNSCNYRASQWLAHPMSALGDLVRGVLEGCRAEMQTRMSEEDVPGQIHPTTYTWGEFSGIFVTTFVCMRRGKGRNPSKAIVWNTERNDLKRYFNLAITVELNLEAGPEGGLCVSIPSRQVPAGEMEKTLRDNALWLLPETCFRASSGIVESLKGLAPSDFWKHCFGLKKKSRDGLWPMDHFAAGFMFSISLNVSMSNKTPLLIIPSGNILHAAMSADVRMSCFFRSFKQGETYLNAVKLMAFPHNPMERLRQKHPSSSSLLAIDQHSSTLLDDLRTALLRLGFKEDKIKSSASLWGGDW